MSYNLNMSRLLFETGLFNHIEKMSLYNYHIQAWLDRAYVDLRLRHLENRWNEILDLSDLFDMYMGGVAEVDDDKSTNLFALANRSISYEVNDIGRQLSVLALAIATGSEFLFENGEDANQWILRLITELEDQFHFKLRDYLPPSELIDLARSTSSI